MEHTLEGWTLALSELAHVQAAYLAISQVLPRQKVEVSSSQGNAKIEAGKKRECLYARPAALHLYWKLLKELDKMLCGSWYGTSYPINLIKREAIDYKRLEEFN